MQIGPYKLSNNLALAPMAGITDRPFRELCRRFGAGMAVSEMVASRPELRNTEKSLVRRDHAGESGLRIVQIVGSEPEVLAEAARFNVAEGAQVIDINMGCPAKKVCRKFAGSALLADEGLVEAILQAVVEAVDVPVTLKTRTGTEPGHRNGPRVAAIAQECGIAALAVHGRTRADLYKGEAEYDTIREICRSVDIPVWANGDIDSPQKAEQVLAHTGADGIMVGRGAQGRPWLFGQIAHYLATGEIPADPPVNEIRQVLTEHLRGLHGLYGETKGVRIARKHIGWYLSRLPGGESARCRINRVDQAGEQFELLDAYFRQLMDEEGVAA